MKAIIEAILFAFQANHDYAKAKRQARQVGIDIDADDEWGVSNEIG